MTITQKLIEQLSKIKAKIKHHQSFRLQNQNLSLDLSRHYLDQQDLTEIASWLEQQGFNQKIHGLFENNQLNFTEKRSVDHVRLRDPSYLNDPLNHQAQHQQAFANDFAAHKITGFAGHAITDLLIIGIGGSHLGAHFIVDALQDYCRSDVALHFLTGTDPHSFTDLIQVLKPQTTLVFVASKTFSTLETLMNFEKLKECFKQQLTETDFLSFCEKQFFALTANPSKAQALGFQTQHIFTLPESIGGRFSLWSAIGLPMRLILGENHFKALLAGAYEMDQHFRQSALSKNSPVLLALLDFYYGNQAKVQQRAVVPYSQRLRLLIDHLQQLEMESNGKSINSVNERVDYHTGLAVWGGVGPNSQHSFHQYFYQGTACIPIDFLIIDQASNLPDFNQLLKIQCLAQAKALWEGNSDESTPKSVEGGTPSTVISLSHLNPQAVGELIALYEHKVFVMALLTDTNAFDQFGVELGKEQTQAMLPETKLC